jgi:hypothetical protein
VAIDGGVDGNQDSPSIGGQWTILRDVEVYGSRPNRKSATKTDYTCVSGVGSKGSNNKIINCIIHDTCGCGAMNGGPNTEFYGNIVYNNGYDGLDTDRPHGHGFYLQNTSGSYKRLRENSIFSNYSHGEQAYSETGTLDGTFEFTGNVGFNTSVASTFPTYFKDNFEFGGFVPVRSVTFRENMAWTKLDRDGGRNVQFGYQSSPDGTAVLENNYISGKLDFGTNWTSVTITGNTIGSLTGTRSPANYPNNIYLFNRPTGQKVFLRRNEYDSTRSHLIVYNWDLLDTLTLTSTQLDQVLVRGSGFEIRNAQNYFAAPLASGTYNGNSVTVPLNWRLNSSLVPAQPIGSPGAITQSEYTDKEFNVFVILATVAPPPGPPAAPRNLRLN